MISILKNFNKKEWMMTAVVFLLTILEVGAGLVTVEFVENIVGLLVNGAEIGEVLRYGGIMVGFSLLSVLIGVVISFVTVRIATGYARRLRSMLFERVSSFSMHEINKYSTASLITRSTNDINQIQMAVNQGIRMIFVAPIIAVTSIIMIVDKSRELTLTTAIGIVALCISIVVIFMIVFPRFKHIQEATDSLNGVSREHLTGLRVIRAYNAEEYQQAAFETVNNDLSLTHRFVTRMMGVLMPWCYFLMDALGLAILWIGSYLIEGNMLELPQMMSFELYANMTLSAFMMMTMMALMIPRAAISAKRINEVLETEPSIRDKASTISPSDDRRGEVVFDHVSFGYNGSEHYAVKDISFSLAKGETLAIIGATGSGKSTIVNLIPRFYDVQEGSITIDGVDVRDMAERDLRSRIGLVAQHATLFSGTIESNIKYTDKDMSDERMREAAHIAAVDEFIDKEEDGYKTHVAQGGSNFSGGQKQRISIARAIAKHPEIYIFDDSFSALDYATDKKVRADLKSVTADSSVIIVAQRLGTIMDADKIVVLDKGKMVGYGTHRELLVSCPVYKEIALSQLSEEELENA